MNESAAASNLLGRRTFLTGLGIAGGLLLTPTTGIAAFADEVPPGRVTTDIIEGSDASATLLAGHVSIVLTYVLRRFHYEISPLKAGDIVGYDTYRSGTTVTVQPGMYPPGASGCLFPQQVAVVRDVLAECRGVVRWGGDDKRLPQEGSFRIDSRPDDTALSRVADEILAGNTGIPPDPFTASRRRAAQQLAALQTATG